MDARDDDARTVLLAIAGGEDAYEALVRRHQARITILLIRICGNAALAEDLAQITFVKAWRRIGALRDATLFLPWLRRIAVNTAVDAARKGAIAVEPLDEHESAATTPLRNNAPDCRLDLDAAMARLSFGQRACVHLALVEGLSHIEIAEALQMPVGTVKSHLARALPLLRSCLKDWRDELV
jgi:RNA polymerase sigma-70 factor (ECF subfamily)